MSSVIDPVPARQEIFEYLRASLPAYDSSWGEGRRVGRSLRFPLRLRALQNVRLATSRILSDGAP